MHRMRTTIISLFIGVVVSLGLLVTVARAAPAITSPAPGSTLSGATATFTWTAGGTANITQWWLYVGTSGVGSNNLFNASTGTATSQEVSGLPTDGSTVYVRLYWKVAGVSWASTDDTYTAFTSGGGGGGGGLSAVPPWAQNLAAAERFVRVLPTAATPLGEGVLDKETGLVWEQSPLTSTQTWSSARVQCMSRTVGDKKGWRLPSVHELASLVDPNNSNPALPTGHPFSNVQSFDYWSASSNVVTPTTAWGMFFGNGVVGTGDKTNGILFVWCVRGGGPLSEY